jgi:subtilisin family serine protease
MPSQICRQPYSGSLRTDLDRARRRCPATDRVGFVLLGLALAMSVLVCPVGGAAPSAHPQLIRPDHGPAYRADRILIIPKPGRSAQLPPFHARHGVRLVQSFPDFGGVQVLELPAGARAPDFVGLYLRSGHVQAAHVDHWFEPATTPDDPYLVSGTQWHLNNLGLSGGVAGADIHATNAWEVLNSASNIIVAILDSGVRQTHEDLAANLWVNPAETAGNGVDDDGNGIVDDIHGINGVVGSGDPEDDTGHGTHVAGIIGAVGNNGLGTCGVAWRVQLMPCKFLTASGGSESSLLQCLDYARVKGAKVINCSFTADASAISVSLSNAFLSIRNAGIIVVAAAGNSGLNIDFTPQYPASFAMDNIIAVTSTTRTDGFSGFNYGPNTVHLGAPGTSIFSTEFGFDSNYGTMSGTSMAAPCVSGAVALLRARFPGLNYRQIISRLLATVDPLPSLAGRCITGGRLNLARALGNGEFTAQSALFAWVPTNGMTPLVLTGDGVSPGLPLPFSYQFYGRSYSQIFIGANGLIGFTNTAMDVSANVDIPSATGPNGIICPYWDDLDPSQGGSIWMGTTGVAPHRAVVVSWAEVPHAINSGGATPLTFQAILHETGEVGFQYLEVMSGNSVLVAGKSATVGVEDDTGLIGTHYSFSGIPTLLTNQQAVLFVPRGVAAPGAALAVSRPLPPSPVGLELSGSPGQRFVLSASPDLLAWSSFATNTLPASGLIWLPESALPTGGEVFYRAQLQP